MASWSLRDRDWSTGRLRQLEFVRQSTRKERATQKKKMFQKTCKSVVEH